jgi:glucose uptake protein
MFVLQTYSLAVIFCVITMLCWGSWANTQKLAGKRWRFELFYWDYVLGVLLMALIFAFTLGSFGESGRSFLSDLKQAEASSFGWAFLGGIIFNLANILLVAAIAIAGMSVAFPVGIGLALVVGVLINYLAEPKGNDPFLLFLGVAAIAAAIVLDALAYRKLPGQIQGGTKGLVLSVLCGLLMGTFYFSVTRAMSPLPTSSTGQVQLEMGKLSPYTAMVVFSLGMLASNFLFNTAIMVRPFTGLPVPLGDYFKGTGRDHLWGLVGGAIWAVGMTFNLIAGPKATFAISYGLGQGATMVAAIWGVFIWREFRQAPRETNLLLNLMFLGYLVGLVLVTASHKEPELAAPVTWVIP